MLAPPPDTKDAWTSILEFVRARTKPQQFDTWFRSLRCLGLDEKAARIATPNAFYKTWMESHYLGLLREACFEVLGTEPRIEFVIEPAPSAGAPGDPALAPPGSSAMSAAARQKA